MEIVCLFIINKYILFCCTIKCSQLLDVPCNNNILYINPVLCNRMVVISLALTTAVWKGSQSCKFGPSCVASEWIENGGLCCPCRLPGTRLAVGMATLWQ